MIGLEIPGSRYGRIIDTEPQHPDSVVREAIQLLTAFNGGHFTDHKVCVWVIWHPLNYRGVKTRIFRVLGFAREIAKWY